MSWVVLAQNVKIYYIKKYISGNITQYMNVPQKIILFYQSSGQDETFDMQQPIFQNDFQISNPILYCALMHMVLKL